MIARVNLTDHHVNKCPCGANLMRPDQKSIKKKCRVGASVLRQPRKSDIMDFMCIHTHTH